MAIFKFLKTTIIGGVLVILPVALMAVGIVKAIGVVRGVLAPIVAMLPAWLQYPSVVAAVLVVAFCFLAGVLVRTKFAQVAGRAVDRGFLEKIPGYTVFKTLTRRLSGQGDESAAVALVSFEDHQEIGFVMERLPDGRSAVFIPSVPTATSGGLMILPADRIKVLDAPMKKAFSCFSHWGTGTAELLAGKV
jgi:uncharacterized membrane protein